MPLDAGGWSRNWWTKLEAKKVKEGKEEKCETKSGEEASAEAGIRREGEGKVLNFC
jgi:hypothetical protein